MKGAVAVLAMLTNACATPPASQPPVVVGPVVDPCNAALFDASQLPPACLLHDAPSAEHRPPKDAVSLHLPALTVRSGDLATFPIELENVSDHALTFEVERRCPDVEVVGHDIRCEQGFCGNDEGAQTVCESAPITPTITSPTFCTHSCAAMTDFTSGSPCPSDPSGTIGVCVISGSLRDTDDNLYGFCFQDSEGHTSVVVQIAKRFTVPPPLHAPTASAMSVPIEMLA